MTTHRIIHEGHMCSCGQDACSCQVCGQRVCGNSVEWVNVGVVLNRSDRNFMGNVCKTHIARRD